ncbi:hypothetical protein BDZ45DRAFT_584489, partial [Acephala macrosclerotiorum]
VKVKDPGDLFYNDLLPEKQTHWESQPLPHSFAAKFEDTKTVAWRTIPRSYLIYEDDNTIPPFVQEAMAQKCQEEGAEMTAKRTKSGHSPFLSKVDGTADFLRRAAGEKF